MPPVCSPCACTFAEPAGPAVRAARVSPLWDSLTSLPTVALAMASPNIWGTSMRPQGQEFDNVWPPAANLGGRPVIYPTREVVNTVLNGLHTVGSRRRVNMWHCLTPPLISLAACRREKSRVLCMAHGQKVIGRPLRKLRHVWGAWRRSTTGFSRRKQAAAACRRLTAQAAVCACRPDSPYTPLPRRLPSRVGSLGAKSPFFEAATHGFDGAGAPAIEGRADLRAARGGPVIGSRGRASSDGGAGG